MSLTHLERLEAEALHIMREVVAEADRPVMLHSIGKDSPLDPELRIDTTQLPSEEAAQAVIVPLERRGMLES
jgi:3'-phosphoadenosine 5'-phosphosulfate sulfotransferase (PAPS reductase)/FAD synthetase